MNDYKELIENLRMAGKSVELADGSFDIYLPTVEKCHNAADAIEQLVKERDAAIANLKSIRACRFCKNEPILLTNEPCNSCAFDNESKFEWCGVQEE